MQYLALQATHEMPFAGGQGVQMGRNCNVIRWLAGIGRLMSLLVPSLLVSVAASHAAGNYLPDNTYVPPNPDSIIGSRHDLSHIWHTDNMSGYFSNYGDQVCVYCHTPHSASVNKALWNRNKPGASSYLVYTSFVSKSTTPKATPNLSSLMCLSCHDGTLAVDSVVNVPSAGAIIRSTHQKMQFTAQNCGSCHANPLANPYNGDAHYALKSYLGIDPGWTDGYGTITRPYLANDHPISMAYPSEGQDPGMKRPLDDMKGWETGATTDVKLVGGYVECVSCHDPHRPGDPRQSNHTYPFLRKTNVGSALCLTCHDK